MNSSSRSTSQCQTRCVLLPEWPEVLLHHNCSPTGDSFRLSVSFQDWVGWEIFWTVSSGTHWLKAEQTLRTAKGGGKLISLTTTLNSISEKKCIATLRFLGAMEIALGLAFCDFKLLFPGQRSEQKCAINNLRKNSGGLSGWPPRGPHQMIYVRIFPFFQVLSGWPTGLTYLVAPYCAIPRDYLSDTPLLRAMGFLVSQHGQFGAIPPPLFLSVSPL